MIKMRDTVKDIINSKAKIKMPLTGASLVDYLNFGISYIEQQDHIVEYIAAGPDMLKRIFSETDAVIKPTDRYVGELWTAKLLYTEKLRSDQLLFSNSEFSVVLDLNGDQNGSL